MAEGSESGWQLTESDPGVFSELLHKLGVPLIVDDLYSLDSESLVLLKPIHALIFLFKYVGGSGSGAGAAGGTSRADPDFGGFFAHQTVNNACATLAVLNALGNLPNVTKASTNEEYKNLMGFAGDLDPQSRGIVITSADWLREAHNSLSPPSAISLDGLGLEKVTEEAYHFVVYLPVGNTLYELDGLREFAVNHGSFSPSGEGWLGKAREVIQARIAIYEPGALEFSLLALRDDPLPGLEKQLNALQASGNQANAAEVMINLEAERHKRERWAFENSLRRHNHLGLLHALVLALAKAGKLNSAKEGAKGIMKTRREKAAKAGGRMDEE